MSYNKISSIPLQCSILIERDFDIELRLQKRLEILHDINISIDVPSNSIYDILISVIRILEEDLDLHQYDKEDSASYFSVYNVLDYVHSSYLSTDLSVLQSSSIRLNKPLSKFLSLASADGTEIMGGVNSKYIAMDFCAVQDFDSLKVGFPGAFCVGFDTTLTSTSSVTNHKEFMDTFDVSKVCLFGNVSEIKLNGSIWNSIACVFTAFLYVPNNGTYYFAVKSTFSVELQINDIIVSSKYSNTEIADKEWGYISITEGYHLLTVRYMKYGWGDADLEIYIKTSETNQDFLMSVDNCNFLGMDLRCLNYPSKYSIKEDSNYIDFPMELVNMDPGLLYLNSYVPLNILCKMDSPLLSGLLSKLYIDQIPDEINVHPSLVYGVIENLSSDYTFNANNNGVVLDLDSYYCENTYIELVFNEQKGVDAIQIVEGRDFYTHTYSKSQAKRLLFSINDDSNDKIRASKLLHLVDIEMSSNILDIVWHSMHQIRVEKIDQSDGVILKFKSEILLRRIKINPAECDSQTDWGIIYKVRAFTSNPAIRFFNANKGFLNRHSFLSTNPENFVIDYSDFTSIPVPFKSKKVPNDIKKGSDIIMFVILPEEDLNDLEILGNLYVYVTENPGTQISCLFRTKFLDINNRFNFGLYTDLSKEIEYDWSLLGFDFIQNKVVSSDFTLFTINIDNSGGMELTDYYIDIKIYNTGIAFSATLGVDSVPIAGLNSNLNMVMSPDDWDTDTVRLMIPNIPADSSISVTLTQADNFSNPANDMQGGTSNAIPEPIVKSNLWGLNLVQANIGTVMENSPLGIFALKSETSNPKPNLTYNIPNNPTVSSVLVAENNGENIDAEVRVDVEHIITQFGRMPITLVDSTSRLVLPTVGENLDGVLTSNFFEWNSNFLHFTCSLIGGESKLFFIRIGNFANTLDGFNILTLISDDDVNVHTESLTTLKPTSKITTLVDLKTKDGTFKVIHSYSGMNEMVVENIIW